MSSCLITGHAGDIGRATSELARSRGHRVIGLDIRSNPNAADRELIVDLADRQALGRAFAEFRSSSEPIDYLINVAGGASVDEAMQDPLKVDYVAFDAAIALNLIAPYELIKLTLPLMTSALDRSVTLVSSTNSLGGFGLPAYSAAKAGTESLARSLAEPLGSSGIRINAVQLGTVRTAGFVRASTRGDVGPDFDFIASRIPLKRVLEPVDAARAIAAAAFDLVGTTGSVFRIDGGQSLRRRR